MIRIDFGTLYEFEEEDTKLKQENRKKIAKYYLENITNENLLLPMIITDSSWHLFVIRSKNREELQKYLAANKIQTLIHYPIPPHKQNAYREWSNESYPVSEHIHDEILSLPISGIQTLLDAKKIVKLLNIYKNYYNKV